jgi:hypothetical protein
MPSLHQLLPIYPCYDTGGGNLGRVYEVPNIGSIDPAKAQAANAFHREIEAAVNKHLGDNAYLADRYAINAVVGRTQLTSQSARPNNGRIEMQTTYKGTDLEGDGTVPKVSATPIEMKDDTPRIYADEKHASLQNADSVLVNVVGILDGLDIHSNDFKATKTQAAGVALRLSLADAYPADQPLRMTVTPREDWVDLEAAVVDVDSGKTVQTRPAPAGATPDRAINFGGLPAGTYRVSVGGDGATTVNDVFVVL